MTESLLIHVISPHLHWSRRRCRRAITLIDAIGALLMHSPVLVAPALIVWAHDRGHFLMAQKRMGLHRMPFDMPMLRSTHTDAEEHWAALPSATGVEGGAGIKLRHPPRTIALGRCMRQESLDESPQLLIALEVKTTSGNPRPPPPCQDD
ncbi:sugar transferase [Kocuria rhizosphaericola]|uniref:sugar transferase n=1 Tax=Kocuria rhizosphaericola TaxID=3376284 RepID=UPI0037AEAB09